MQRALIVYASRHGATEGIAERIRDVLETHGIEASVAAAAYAPDPRAYDAVVVGSGVYMGSWLKHGIEYLERFSGTLQTRPTWIFSSGPIPGSSKEVPEVEDRYGGALGPADGPGSGGRKRIELLADLIGVRDHRIFQGAYDPSDSPKAMSERLARMLPSVQAILPEGDFREWDKIEEWAGEIAGEIAHDLVPA
jgi:menaquinone-dependent protoporphyrinogen oxidase